MIMCVHECVCAVFGGVGGGGQRQERRRAEYKKGVGREEGGGREGQRPKVI